MPQFEAVSLPSQNIKTMLCNYGYADWLGFGDLIPVFLVSNSKSLQYSSPSQSFLCTDQTTPCNFQIDIVDRFSVTFPSCIGLFESSKRIFLFTVWLKLVNSSENQNVTWKI